MYVYVYACRANGGILSWAGWLPCLTGCLSIPRDDMNAQWTRSCAVLSCLQLGAVQNTAPSIECSLQSAVRILPSPPCTRAVHVESEPEFVASYLCRAVGAAPLHPTIASADGGYVVVVEMPGQKLDYSRCCPQGHSQRAVEGPRQRFCGLCRDTWADCRVWLLAGTRVVEPVGTCSTGGYGHGVADCWLLMMRAVTVPR